MNAIKRMTPRGTAGCDSVVSLYMEDAMFRSLAFIAAAIVASALVTSSRVEAGASASAPSKYSRVSANQQRQDTNVPITEYSSSARRTQHKH
jgi:hypothetical protein